MGVAAKRKRAVVDSRRIIGLSHGERSNKLIGDHARLLKWFSEAVKLFYHDLSEHGLADSKAVLGDQYSNVGFLA